MNGGPSQMDTFDLKPGHANGGPFKEIQTSAPGLKISEHLPKIAKFGDKLAVIRSMSTKEADMRSYRLVSQLDKACGKSNLVSQLRFSCSSFDLSTRCAYYWAHQRRSPCELT